MILGEYISVLKNAGSVESSREGRARTRAALADGGEQRATARRAWRPRARRAWPQRECGEVARALARGSVKRSRRELVEQLGRGAADASEPPAGRRQLRRAELRGALGQVRRQRVEERRRVGVRECPGRRKELSRAVEAELALDAPSEARRSGASWRERANAHASMDTFVGCSCARRDVASLATPSKSSGGGNCPRRVLELVAAEAVELRQRGGGEHRPELAPRLTAVETRRVIGLTLSSNAQS